VKTPFTNQFGRRECVEAYADERHEWDGLSYRTLCIRGRRWGGGIKQGCKGYGVECAALKKMTVGVPAGAVGGEAGWRAVHAAERSSGATPKSSLYSEVKNEERTIDCLFTEEGKGRNVSSKAWSDKGTLFDVVGAWLTKPLFGKPTGGKHAERGTTETIGLGARWNGKGRELDRRAEGHARRR